MRPGQGRPSRRVVLGATGAAVLGLAGCSGESSDISKQAREGDNKGYIAGDGQIQKLASDERKAPVTVSGTLMDGKHWSSAQHRGRIVVLNVWGAWCGPCQEEMPHLQRAWEAWQKAGDDVLLMGLDQRDSVQAARATLRRFKITYPSLRDDGGRTLLSLQGKVATYPTTVVLDPQGRIAARISGQTTQTTLRDLVDDVRGKRT